MMPYSATIKRLLNRFLRLTRERFAEYRLEANTAPRMFPDTTTGYEPKILETTTEINCSLTLTASRLVTHCSLTLAAN